MWPYCVHPLFLFLPFQHRHSISLCLELVRAPLNIIYKILKIHRWQAANLWQQLFLPKRTWLKVIKICFETAISLKVDFKYRCHYHKKINKSSAWWKVFSASSPPPISNVTWFVLVFMKIGRRGEDKEKCKTTTKTMFRVYFQEEKKILFN